MLDRSVTAGLENAVSEGNALKVRTILYGLADVGPIIKEELGLLLHDDAITEETATILLLHGADVGTFNRSRNSPLHSAIINRKEAGFIELLLKHGANVYASNRRGNTPLYIALKRKYRNPDVIRLLLEYGADINIVNRERRIYGNHYSSLEYSMYHVPSAKLLVKYILLKNFKNDYEKILNLHPFKDHPNYSVVASYFDECVSEISAMDNHIIVEDLSLYQLVVMRDKVTMQNLSLSDLQCISNALIDIIFCNCYPIYFDAILSSECARLSLLHKLETFKFGSFDLGHGQHIVLLDSHCLYRISKYLSNAELLNVILAAYNW